MCVVYLQCKISSPFFLQHLDSGLSIFFFSRLFFFPVDIIPRSIMDTTINEFVAGADSLKEFIDNLCCVASFIL